MPISVDTLPSELYGAIIDHIPVDLRQQFILSLTRAIPRAPIPAQHLFRHIRLRYGAQSIKLYLCLRNNPGYVQWVKDFTLETWIVDANVVLNLIALLTNLDRLTLFVGPNFNPEHLEEMFEKPMTNLRFISLRFRPYVQKATYYQFLKGAYFDSTLHQISQWPTSPLPTLSIIQDPIDPQMTQKQHFAQPLVFFRLDPVTTLVRSEYLKRLTSLRLRIPGRQYVRFICAYPDSLPNLQLLDLSTCMILESDVENLLSCFTKLRHLVFDVCSMKWLDLLDGEWVTLGRSCAVAGVRRAKEREKKLKAWLEANIVSQHEVAANTISIATPSTQDVRPARRGRRGLATANISLKEPSERESSSSTAQGTFAAARVRILPSSPSLASLAITTVSQYNEAGDVRDQAVQADFERGWIEGLAQVTAIRNRLHQSWRNGIRVLRFSSDNVLSDEGFDGLIDVDKGEETGDVFGELRQDDVNTPILCLAGPGRKQGHTSGCGHTVSWDIWDDEL